MPEPEVVVLDDPASVAEEGARRVVAALDEAIRERGEAHLALTGGSSAIPLYQRLQAHPYRQALDWTKVHFWWGGDRYVPADHPESNTGLAYTFLLGMAARMTESGEGAGATDVLAGLAPGLDVLAANIHPMPINQAIQNARGQRWAAEEYARTLRELLPPDGGGVPILDLILAGVGPDGHIFSAFPGGEALAEDAPLVIAVPAPEHVEPHVPRVTLSPRLLPAARRVLVMATGRGKAERLREILRGELDRRRLPAQFARNGNATWLLDRGAASGLASG